ncbi:VOC family protein [Acidipropionibacterium virtanenii]|uniref:VOC domain-containing protein n=1 Tax=Acidipropionibacterium virtanenii TaxID=2057246 RepID=A0A344UXR3_9ACTN|nr:VOC family protein [Acidipropionibacterium virtanenii]AXE40061.1 hypothetical protein JS278_02927 [Acidipropionibacterium virtanenii]
MKVMSIIADIPVPDMERARAFYTDYLGLGEEEFSLGWAARLTQPDTRASLQILTADATGPENPAISVKVEDVEAAYREAVDRGYEIAHPLTQEPWGVYRFFVRGPGGVVINIAQDH